MNFRFPLNPRFHDCSLPYIFNLSLYFAKFLAILLSQCPLFTDSVIVVLKLASSDPRPYVPVRYVNKQYHPQLMLFFILDNKYKSGILALLKTFCPRDL